MFEFVCMLHNTNYLNIHGLFHSTAYIINPQHKTGISKAKRMVPVYTVSIIITILNTQTRDQYGHLMPSGKQIYVVDIIRV